MLMLLFWVHLDVLMPPASTPGSGSTVSQAHWGGCGSSCTPGHALPPQGESGPLGPTGPAPRRPKLRPACRRNAALFSSSAKGIAPRSQVLEGVSPGTLPSLVLSPQPSVSPLNDLAFLTICISVTILYIYQLL